MAMQAVTDRWSVINTAGAAAQATISKAAGASGVKHVAKRAIMSHSAGATAGTPVAFNLRDGATGAGTVIATWELSSAANTSVTIDADNLELAGTAATAMTLESGGAGAAATVLSVTLIGYDLP